MRIVAWVPSLKTVIIMLLAYKQLLQHKSFVLQSWTLIWLHRVLLESGLWWGKKY